jgi:nicotinic acid mononucleotide adenylyltransferase
MNFKSFNDSPWMGSICEVGIGITFQHKFLSEPGASKTILFTHCPYNKAFQPSGISGVIRSVSEKMSRKYAWLDFEKIVNSHDVQDDYIFSLAITGSHKTAEESGETHGWVTVVMRKKSADEPGIYSFHFRISSSQDRDLAAAMVAHQIHWFLRKVLLNEWNSWKEAINNRPQSYTSGIQIDVIRAPDISMEEHLFLATYHTPLVYHRGKFQRPMHYFRRYYRLFGGSFNPPTTRHFNIGTKDSLYCLDFENPRKDSISEEDIAHRIRMLDTQGVPILINRGRKYIVSIHDIAAKYGLNDPAFIIGVDTFNAVCSEKFVLYEDFLRPLYREYGTEFEIIKRDGLQIVDNEWSRRINFKVIEVPGESTSSTRVRNGELHLTTERIRRYILDNNLYQTNTKKASGD